MSRLRCIDAEQACYPVRRLCPLVGVACAGYSAWVRRIPAQRVQAAAALSQALRTIHAQRRAPYGSPRVHAALCAAGTRVRRKRVIRLLQAAGLRGCGRRQTVRTTVSDPATPPAPSLVQRQFDAGALDRVWVTDISCLATAEGWLDLAALLDGCSRRVVGWALADQLRTALALAMALRDRQPNAATLVHHRDRGGQDTAAAYQAVLATPGMRSSMIRTGNGLDNAMAERVNATRKRARLPVGGGPTNAAARAAVFAGIAVVYNRQRLHSSLGFRTPVACERWQLLQHAA